MSPKSQNLCKIIHKEQICWHHKATHLGKHANAKVSSLCEHRHGAPQSAGHLCSLFIS